MFNSMHENGVLMCSCKDILYTNAEDNSPFFSSRMNFDEDLIGAERRKSGGKNRK